MNIFIGETVDCNYNAEFYNYGVFIFQTFRDEIFCDGGNGAKDGSLAARRGECCSVIPKRCNEGKKGENDCLLEGNFIIDLLFSDHKRDP